MALDPKYVDSALRDLISRLDYDLHKYTECDEDEGADRYPELVEEFIGYYEEAEEADANSQEGAESEEDPYEDGENNTEEDNDPWVE